MDDCELEQVVAGKQTLRNIDDAALAYKQASRDISRLSHQLSRQSAGLTASARQSMRNFDSLFPGK